MEQQNATRESSASMSEVLNLDNIWRVVRRRRWLTAAFFLSVLAIGTVQTLRQPKVYDATCTIIIDVQAPRVLEKDQITEIAEAGAGSNYWSTREYSETQYRVIASRAVAQRVADRLGLRQNDKFMGLEKVADEAKREESRQKRDVAGVLLNRLKVEPIKESRIVRIRFEESDPELASLIANAFADAYIAENQAARTATNASASEWLEGQLEEAQRRLDESSKQLFAFKREHDIVSTRWEDRQSMVTQRLTSINDALTQARIKRAGLEARNKALQFVAEELASGGLKKDETVVPVKPGEAVDALKTRYLDEQLRCTDLRVRYLAGHPALAACNEKLAASKAALDSEVRASQLVVRRDTEQARLEEQNLERLLQQTKDESFGLNQYEREYLELKRSYDNNERIFELLLKRIKDTSVSSMLRLSNVRVLDRARPKGGPIRPNVPQNLLVTLLVGLIGGIGVAFGAEFLDRTVRSQEPIEERLKLAFLGIYPRIEGSKDGLVARDLEVFAQPKSVAAECLRTIRTNILFMMPEKPLKTIVVTSAGPQEGKTTAATALAITMAMSGNQVLLVDADMRRPRMHRIFGHSNSAGLSSLTLGEGTLSELVRSTPIPNLKVLTSGPVPPNPSELLHAKAFKRIIDEMADGFDRVIIDSPPVGVVADALVLGTYAHGTVFVLRAGATSIDMARHAVRQLRDVNAHLVGAILNDLNLADHRYDSYAYYYKYGYYEDGGPKASQQAPRGSAA
ncbi:MAG: polysaccharide biosynthesis tyrosine autokinase [Anaeromyxobacteraceae bacterium]